MLDMGSGVLVCLSIFRRPLGRNIFASSIDSNVFVAAKLERSNAFACEERSTYLLHREIIFVLIRLDSGHVPAIGWMTSPASTSDTM